jgi:ADP-ribose pyrophosphatase YjhB (NUDIX family)
MTATGNSREGGSTSARPRQLRSFEEAGLTIDLQSLAGVYTDPHHILAYPDGSVHQQVAICFHATPHDTQPPRPDAEETTAAAWFEPRDTPALPMHPAVRQRLADAITQPDRAHFD